MTHTSPQTIVVTGASDGIGAAAARQLAAGNARLIIVGRSPKKTAAVAWATQAESLVADFTRLDDVRSLAAALQARCAHIDVLAHNAGGMFAGPVRTADGFERTLQVNHLAPVLLTRLLLPLRALTRFLRTPEQGGARLAHVVTGVPGRDWTSGTYYGSPGRIGRSHRVASDPAAIATHWQQSAAMLGVSWPA